MIQSLSYRTGCSIKKARDHGLDNFTLNKKGRAIGRDFVPLEHNDKFGR
jgi:hypothetical protein